MRGVREHLSMFYEPFVVDHSCCAETFGLSATGLTEAIQRTVEAFRGSR
jgi:hypothetical protein